MTTRDCPQRKSKDAASSFIKRVTGADQKEDARATVKVVSGLRQVSATVKQVSIQPVDVKVNSINKRSNRIIANSSQGSTFDNHPIASSSQGSSNLDRPLASSLQGSPIHNHPIASSSQCNPIHNSPSANDESKIRTRHIATRSKGAHMSIQPVSMKVNSINKYTNRTIASSSQESAFDNRPIASSSQGSLIHDYPIASSSQGTSIHDHPIASSSQGNPIHDSPSANDDSKIQTCRIATRSKGAQYNKFVKDERKFNEPTQSARKNEAGVVQSRSDAVEIEKVSTKQIETVAMQFERSMGVQYNKFVKDAHKSNELTQSAKQNDTGVVQSRSDAVEIEEASSEQTETVAIQFERVDASLHIDKVDAPSITYEIDNVQNDTETVPLPATQLSIADRVLEIRSTIDDGESSIRRKRLTLRDLRRSKSYVAVYDSSKCDLDYYPLLSLDPIKSPRTAMEEGQLFSDSCPTSPISPNCRNRPSRWIRELIKKDEYHLSQPAPPDSPTYAEDKGVKLVNKCNRVSPPRLIESEVVAPPVQIDCLATLDEPNWSPISYPCDMPETEFMVLLGLLPKAEVMRIEAAAEVSRRCRDHRLAGGRLRRIVNRKRAPGMIYEGKKCRVMDAARAGSSVAVVGNLKPPTVQKKGFGKKSSVLPTDPTDLEPLPGSPEEPLPGTLAETPGCVEESKNSPALSVETVKKALTHRKLPRRSVGLILSKKKHVGLKGKGLSKNIGKQSSATSSTSSGSTKTQSDIAVKRKRYVVDTSAEPRRSNRHEGEERRGWSHLLRAKPDKHVACTKDDIKSPLKPSSEILLQKIPKVKDARVGDHAQLKRSITDIEPVTSEHPVVLKRSKSCTNSFVPTGVERHSRLPNILSKSVPKTTLPKTTLPKVETVSSSSSSSPVKYENTVTQSNWVKMEEAATCDVPAEPDCLEEPDENVLSQEDYIPADLSILTYRYNEMCCKIPHMCSVCFCNDHMYCKNMKRVARDQPPFGACIHYISCHHYRPVHREISQLSVLEPNEMNGKHSFRWRFIERNQNMESVDSGRARLDARVDVRREFRGGEEDLFCHEEMLASDIDSPRHGRENYSVSGEGRFYVASGGGKLEILHRQLRVRENQIIRCQGRKPGNTPPNTTRTSVVVAASVSAVQDVKLTSRNERTESVVDKPVEVADYGATVEIETTKSQAAAGSYKRDVNKGNVHFHKVRQLLAANEAAGQSSRMAARYVTGEMRLSVMEYPSGTTSLIPRSVAAASWKS